MEPGGVEREPQNQWLPDQIAEANRFWFYGGGELLAALFRSTFCEVVRRVRHVWQTRWKRYQLFRAPCRRLRRCTEEEYKEEQRRRCIFGCGRNTLSIWRDYWKKRSRLIKNSHHCVCVTTIYFFNLHSTLTNQSPLFSFSRHHLSIFPIINQFRLQ